MRHATIAARLLCVLVSGAMLGACASKPPESSIALVEKQLDELYPGLQLNAHSLGQASVPPVNGSLDLQKTIQIMLSHSPRVRMLLAETGVADASALQAELIDNPHVSLGALKPESGGRWQLDASFSQPLLALLTRSLRRDLAQEKVLEAQLNLQRELQLLIAQTTTQFFSAVAALQRCYVQNTMLEATKARQQLALAMYRAGNMSENNFLSYDNELRRMQQQLDRQQTQAYEKQLQLLNLIGLRSTQRLEIPAQLPDLPNEDFHHAELLELATANRADIKILRQQLALFEKRQSLVQQQNGWRDMNLGINAEREFDGATQYGPEIEFSIPIFNRGEGKLAAIQAQKSGTIAQLHQLELDADTEIAQALNLMSAAHSRLQNIKSALAITEKRVELSNREVNFMLGSPFELLAIKRQQIQLAHDFTDALKEYWQARAALELAIGQSIPMNSSSPQKMHGEKSSPTHDHSKHEEHNHD